MRRQRIRNWDTTGEPLLIDIRRQIVARVTGSQPLWFRRYAWQIRKCPRLAVRQDRAMVLWSDHRTACPPEYRAAVASGAQ